MQIAPFPAAYHGGHRQGNHAPWRRWLAVALILLGLAGCDRAPEPKLVNQQEGAGNLSNAASAPVSNDTPPASAHETADRAAPADGLPKAMLGLWGGLDEAECGARGSIFRLEVEPDRLRFYESVGMIEGVRPLPDGSVVADIAYSGEGQSWNRDQTLTLSQGGQRLTIKGVGADIVRKRCS